MVVVQGLGLSHYCPHLVFLMMDGGLYRLHEKLSGGGGVIMGKPPGSRQKEQAHW